MEYEYLDCEILDGAAQVQLIGSGLFSMSELAEEFIDLMLRLQADKAVRLILLTDGDGSFIIPENRTQLAEQKCQGQGIDNLAPNLDSARQIVALIQESAKPMITAVRGSVNGGGLGLFLAADVCLASSTATFSAPDMRCGLFPFWGLSFTLPRLLGPGRTLEFLWSQREIGAREAGQLGLVDRVIADEVWESELVTFSNRLAQLPQPAVHLAKLAVQQAAQLDLTSMLSYEFEAQQQCWDSHETAVSMAAYLSGTEPEFGVPQSTDNE